MSSILRLLIGLSLFFIADEMWHICVCFCLHRRCVVTTEGSATIPTVCPDPWWRAVGILQSHFLLLRVYPSFFDSNFLRSNTHCAAIPSQFVPVLYVALGLWLSFAEDKWFLQTPPSTCHTGWHFEECGWEVSLTMALKDNLRYQSMQKVGWCLFFFLPFPCFVIDRQGQEMLFQLTINIIEFMGTRTFVSTTVSQITI